MIGAQDQKPAATKAAASLLSSTTAAQPAVQSPVAAPAVAAPPVAAAAHALNDEATNTTKNAAKDTTNPTATALRRVSPLNEEQRFLLMAPKSPVDLPLQRIAPPEMSFSSLQKRKERSWLETALAQADQQQPTVVRHKKRRVAVRSHAKRYFPHQHQAATAAAGPARARPAAAAPARHNHLKTNDEAEPVLHYRTDGTVLVVRDGHKNNNAAEHAAAASAEATAGDEYAAHARKQAPAGTTRGGDDVFSLINSSAAKLASASGSSNSSADSSSTVGAAADAKRAPTSFPPFEENSSSSSSSSSGSSMDVDDDGNDSSSVASYESFPRSASNSSSYKKPPPPQYSTSQYATGSKIDQAIYELFDGDEQALVRSVVHHCVEGGMSPADYSQNILGKGVACKKTVIRITQYWQGVTPSTVVERWKNLCNLVKRQDRKPSAKHKKRKKHKKPKPAPAAASRPSAPVVPVAVGSSSGLVCATSYGSGVATTKIDLAIQKYYDGDPIAFVLDVKKRCVDGDINPTQFSRRYFDLCCLKTVIIVSQYWMGREPTTAVSRWKHTVAEARKLEQQQKSSSNDTVAVAAEPAPMTKIDQAIRDVFDGDEVAFALDVKKYCVDGDMHPGEYSEIRLQQGLSCKKTVFMLTQYWRGKTPSMDIGRWRRAYKLAAAAIKQKQKPAAVVAVAKKPSSTKATAAESPLLEIGTALSILWDQNSRYYKATVRDRNDEERLHLVEYQVDGVMEWVDLGQRTFKLFSNNKRIVSGGIKWDGSVPDDYKNGMPKPHSTQKKSNDILPKPGVADVVLGRGPDIYAMPGNQQFRAFCQQAVKQASPGAENKEIAQAVIRSVTEQGGRFLEKLGKGSYVEADSERAHQKSYFSICRLKSLGPGSSPSSRKSSPAAEDKKKKAAPSGQARKKSGIITRLSATDVLYGKGRHISDLPGNQRFRDLCREAYEEASDDDHYKDIARVAVDKVYEQNDPPGRFVESNGDDPETYTIVEDEERAIGKAFTCVRRLNIGPSSRPSYEEPPLKPASGGNKTSPVFKPSKKISGIERLSRNDVLFGAGMGIQNLPGNQAFRELCREKYDEADSNKNLKDLAPEIVRAVWERNGRFVERSTHGGTYTTVDDERAISKAYALLRKIKYEDALVESTRGASRDETDESSSEEEEEMNDEKPSHLRSGTRVAIYDADDDRYYEAIVRGRSMNLHKLEYTNNNATEWVDLAEHTFVVVS